MRPRVLFAVVIGGGALVFLLWATGGFRAGAAEVAPAPRVLRPPLVVLPRVPAGYEAIGQKIQGVMQEGPRFQEGESLAIYRLRSVDPAQVRAQATGLANRTLGKIGGGKLFSAEALLLDDDYLFARNDKGLKLRAYANSGFISLINQERVFQGECAALSQSQAGDIARKFVTDNRIVDLLPNERLTVADFKYVRSQGVLAKGGQRSEVVLNNIIIILGRQLEGKEVIGPGGRVVVFLSGGGEVVGFHRNWREVEPVAVDRVKGKGPAAAARAVTAELSRILGPQPPPAQALQVRCTECGYFAAGKHQAQKFLQPAYAVHIEVEGEKMPHIAQVIVVSGADRLLEPLAPVAAELKGQPRAVRVPLTTRDDD